MALSRVRRYAPGVDFISFGDRVPTAAAEVVPIRAEDGVESKGVLYSRRTEKTVVCVMHPRADMSRHYAIPDIVEAGFAFFAQVGRCSGDDISAATIHEFLLADVAAGLTFLRARGFERIVLLGNSGAAALYSLYLAQAKLAPPGRLNDTAAGDPYDLNKFAMPEADGMIFLGAHLGPGLTFADSLDPSILDEHDPLSCDPELDMYDPRNGFREPPQSSPYPEEFVARYRSAQRIRAGRIDALAWSLVHRQRDSVMAFDGAGFSKLDADERRQISRRAATDPFMQLFRLEADLRNVDLSIDPSDREYGSLMFSRPDLANYSPFGSKVLNPRVWLSSWSARYSRAAVLPNLPALSMPTLVVTYSGDNALRTDVAYQIFSASPATDKQRETIVGDHFGFPVSSKPNQGGREAALDVIVRWLRERYPTAVRESQSIRA